VVDIGGENTSGGGTFEDPGIHKEVSSRGLGPRSVHAGRTFDLVLKEIKKEADKVHAFNAKMTRVVIDHGKHYRVLDIDYMTIREMASGNDLLSRRMWKQLIQPYLKEIFAALESRKILTLRRDGFDCGIGE